LKLSVEEIAAKSILIKRKMIDSWFVSRYGMNLYRGCRHNCAYCDGRAESYYVEGEFGRDVQVKINAPEILRRELDPGRRRKPLKGGYFFLGGGVSDSYQVLEETYRLTRRALELMEEFGHPVQILTKSTLVLRDLDVLERINRRSRALIGISLSSVDEGISRIYEPGVPSPAERLEILRQAKARGIPCAVFLLPVIPYVTDGEDLFDRALKSATEAGADFLIFGSMTLKQGRQAGYFLGHLARHHPESLEAYGKIYGGDRWGQPAGAYVRILNERFLRAAAGYSLPLRMPPELFGDLLDDRDRVVVILDQMDYLFRLRGRRSAYGAASRAIAGMPGPIRDALTRGELPSGVSTKARALIEEILETGTAGLYEELLHAG
jgi:DNA repair photolyase